MARDTDRNAQSITAPVTDGLLDELGTAKRMLDAFKAEKARAVQLPYNDREHYGKIVSILERLALAVLRAQSSGSLITPRADGARLDVGQHAPVMIHLNDVLFYLRNDAANLLRHNGGALSPRAQDHAEKVLGLLSKLYHLIMHGIQIQAEKNLDLIADMDPATLVSTGKLLSELARGVKPPKSE